MILVEDPDLYKRKDKEYDVQVLGGLLRILYSETMDGNIRPIFCTNENKKTAEKVIANLYGRASHGVGNLSDKPMVYSLEKLLYNLDWTAKHFKQRKKEKADPFYAPSKPMKSAFRCLEAVTSAFGTFKYDMSVPPCCFHETTDTPLHCSLAKARKRTFVIYDYCCKVSILTKKREINFIINLFRPCHVACCTVAHCENYRNLISPKKISSNQLFSDFFIKSVTFTKFLQKMRESELP